MVNQLAFRFIMLRLILPMNIHFTTCWFPANKTGEMG